MDLLTRRFWSSPMGGHGVTLASTGNLSVPPRLGWAWAGADHPAPRVRPTAEAPMRNSRRSRDGPSFPSGSRVSVLAMRLLLSWFDAPTANGGTATVVGCPTSRVPVQSAERRLDGAGRQDDAVDDPVSLSGESGDQKLSFVTCRLHGC